MLDLQCVNHTKQTTGLLSQKRVKHNVSSITLRKFSVNYGLKDLRESIS